jgi:hypothetical protein
VAVVKERELTGKHTIAITLHYIPCLMEWKHEIRTRRRLHGRDHAPKRRTFVATSRLFNPTPPINPPLSLNPLLQVGVYDDFSGSSLQAKFVNSSLSHFSSFLILLSGGSARLSYAAFKLLDRLTNIPVKIYWNNRNREFAMRHNPSLRKCPFYHNPWNSF